MTNWRDGDLEEQPAEAVVIDNEWNNINSLIYVHDKSSINAQKFSQYVAELVLRARSERKRLRIWNTIFTCLLFEICPSGDLRWVRNRINGQGKDLGESRLIAEALEVCYPRIKSLTKREE